MLQFQTLILIFLSVESSKSYIFSTNEDKSIQNNEGHEYDTNNGVGWFGSFTRDDIDDKNNEAIENENIEKGAGWFLPFSRQKPNNENKNLEATESDAGWFRVYSEKNDETKSTEIRENQPNGGWFQPFSSQNEQYMTSRSKEEKKGGVSGWFGYVLDKTEQPTKNTETKENRAGWFGPFYSQNKDKENINTSRWNNKSIQHKADGNSWSVPWFRQKSEDKQADLKENESSEGWLELFSQQKKENKTIEIAKIQNFPVISFEWMEKYREMVEELAKFDEVFKESKVPTELLIKYNTSLYQLKEVENRLENRFKVEEITQSKPTNQTLNEEKEQYMSYDWYDKNSDALAKIDEFATSIDNSLTNEIKEVTNTLTDLRKSWELFSFYNIWKEQYKRLAGYWLSLNKSLGGMRDASLAENWTRESIFETLRNTSALIGWADSSGLGKSILSTVRNSSALGGWKNMSFLESFTNTSLLENFNNRSALSSLLSSVVLERLGNKDVLSSWKSSLPEVWSYKDMVTQYLPTIGTDQPVCSSKVLTCPDNTQTFVADTCCSPLWLSIGAPLGLGNECWVDLEKMADQCNIFSCYGNTDNGTYSTDGCTYIPDIMLNYESCVIHDLCYVTPGVTKEDCDEVMKDNINEIYCNNVNMYERQLCSARASLAATALRWTDRYFVAAGIERDSCQLADSWIKTIWKYSFNKVFRPIF